MPSIACYASAVFPDSRIFDTPFDEESYAVFAKEIESRGGTLYITRGLANYLGGNSFANGWKYNAGAWEWVDAPFDVDLIYDKGFDLPKERTKRVVNTAELSRRCLKFETAKLFPDDCPSTVEARDAAGLASAVAKSRTNLIAIKPLDSYGGKGVFIGPKEEAAGHVDTFPVLVQEFIDTSKGIPGIVEGMHDVRVIFIGGKIATVFVRYPAPGKFLSNASQGGGAKQITPEELPSGARVLADRVDATMADIPSRIYSIDMGLDSSGDWKIIELNAPPGLPYQHEGKDVPRHHALLAEHLVKIASGIIS